MEENKLETLNRLKFEIASLDTEIKILEKANSLFL